MPNTLILGGTSEASALARLVAASGLRAILSYAGRVERPRAQPVPVRVGGFGGIEGLITYLREQKVTHLVDATHPFAARMSGHAVAAAEAAGVAHVALTRPAWQAEMGDSWTHVPSLDAAVALLDRPPARIMLALGRMHVDAFLAAPQHHYLLRFVDAPAEPPALPHYQLVIDRGPFGMEADMRLMQAHGTELILCKNAGGEGAKAKLDAARRLSLPVVMIDRPPLPDRQELHSPEAVLRWIGHDAALGV